MRLKVDKTGDALYFRLDESAIVDSEEVGLAEEGQCLAEGELVAVQTIRQIGEWFKGLVETPASEET